MHPLSGKRVAMLVEDEFEDRELTGPLEALRAAGATVLLVGPTAGAEYKGKRGLAVVKSDMAAGAVPAAKARASGGGSCVDAAASASMGARGVVPPTPGCG